jgi:hypothetical protein
MGLGGNGEEELHDRRVQFHACVDDVLVKIFYFLGKGNKKSFEKGREKMFLRCLRGRGEVKEMELRSQPCADFIPSSSRRTTRRHKINIFQFFPS